MSAEMPQAHPVFPARLLRVIDGDSLVLELDRHLGDKSERKIRLLGVDTPEVTGITKTAGLAAKGFTLSWLNHAQLTAENYPLIIEVKAVDSFGRLLVWLWRTEDGANLSDALIESGNADTRSAAMQIQEAKGK